MSWLTLWRCHRYGIHVQDCWNAMYITSCFVPIRMPHIGWVLEQCAPYKCLASLHSWASFWVWVRPTLLIWYQSGAQFRMWDHPWMFILTNFTLQLSILGVRGCIRMSHIGWVLEQCAPYKCLASLHSWASFWVWVRPTLLIVPWNVNKWTGQCPNWVMTLLMNQCDLVAPRQYIVSNLFTSDKGVEEIIARRVK